MKCFELSIDCSASRIFVHHPQCDHFRLSFVQPHTVTSLASLLIHVRETMPNKELQSTRGVDVLLAHGCRNRTNDRTMGVSEFERLITVLSLSVGDIPYLDIVHFCVCETAPGFIALFSVEINFAEPFPFQKYTM